MNRKLEIEARLDRSLARQIAVSRLDRQFDSAVWSRIEAEEGRAANPITANPVPARARGANLSRWLFVSNLIGAGVAVVLAIYFSLRAFGGFEIGLGLQLPSLSPEFVVQAITGVGYVLTLVALGLALSLTSFGRRLLAQVG